jgi:glycosyltransferase involved in cell wall biosynthesis
MPEVTVLIPVRNGAEFVADAIRSVLAQRAVDVRVVASDNRSTDDTAAVLERYATDSRVAAIRQASELSILEHFNRCLAQVDTKYFMILCHDDYLLSPVALGKAHAVMEAGADVNAVFCDLLYVDGRGRRITRRRFGRAGRFDARRVAYESIVSARNQFGIPLLVRTESIRGLRYDESLTCTADAELALASAKGGTLYHLPEPLIANRYHSRNATRDHVATVAREMLVVAERYSIPLTFLDRVRAHGNAYLVAALKLMFLVYTRVKS